LWWWWWGVEGPQKILHLALILLNEGLFQGEKSQKLKSFCPTRWVERHDAVMLFHKLQPAIISSLEEISSWTDVDTSSTANQL